jgi:sulfate adenylyltransferase
MFPPHGGRLVDRLVSEKDRARYKEEAGELFEVPVSLEAKKDYESISYGLFSPLEGPLTANDYSSVLANGRLENGVPWTIPITASPGPSRLFSTCTQSWQLRSVKETTSPFPTPGNRSRFYR